MAQITVERGAKSCADQASRQQKTTAMDGGSRSKTFATSTPTRGYPSGWDTVQKHQRRPLLFPSAVGSPYPSPCGNRSGPFGIVPPLWSVLHRQVSSAARITSDSSSTPPCRDGSVRSFTESRSMSESNIVRTAQPRDHVRCLPPAACSHFHYRRVLPPATFHCRLSSVVRCPLLSVVDYRPRCC